MNKVCLVGRLTKEPTCEYVNTSNGSVARARFTIAVDRGFQANGQDGNRTADFISVVAWRKQAENLVKFQKKGNQIALDGRIQVDSYTGKDGNQVWSTYVVADSIQFLDRKGDAPSNANFDDNISPSDFSSDSNSSKSSTSSEEGASVWDAGSNIEIDPDELPFY